MLCVRVLSDCRLVRLSSGVLGSAVRGPAQSVRAAELASFRGVNNRSALRGRSALLLPRTCDHYISGLTNISFSARNWFRFTSTSREHELKHTENYPL